MPEFEKLLRRRLHYVIHPDYLWSHIADLARTQSDDLLETLRKGFRHIEEEFFENSFRGLFSEINLSSDKLGKNERHRNLLTCKVIMRLAEELVAFSTDTDTLSDAYEDLIGQFAAGSGKKTGEFYTPQQISAILSGIVTPDSQDPATGRGTACKTCWTSPAAPARSCSTCAGAWGGTASA